MVELDERCVLPEVAFFLVLFSASMFFSIFTPTAQKVCIGKISLVNSRLCFSGKFHVPWQLRILFYWSLKNIELVDLLSFGKYKKITCFFISFFSSLFPFFSLSFPFLSPTFVRSITVRVIRRILSRRIFFS